jgi:hypothetical protein
MYSHETARFTGIKEHILINSLPVLNLMIFGPIIIVDTETIDRKEPDRQVWHGSSRRLWHVTLDFHGVDNVFPCVCFSNGQIHLYG